MTLTTALAGGSIWWTSTDFGGDDVAYDVAVQADGKIVVAGNMCDGVQRNVVLARYLLGGKLDTTFSGDAKSTSALGWVGRTLLKLTSTLIGGSWLSDALP